MHYFCAGALVGWVGGEGEVCELADEGFGVEAALGVGEDVESVGGRGGEVSMRCVLRSALFFPLLFSLHFFFFIFFTILFFILHSSSSSSFFSLALPPFIFVCLSLFHLRVHSVTPARKHKLTPNSEHAAPLTAHPTGHAHKTSLS